MKSLSPKIGHKAVLELLSHCGGPIGLRKAGRRKLLSIAAVHAPRMGERLRVRPCHAQALAGPRALIPRLSVAGWQHPAWHRRRR